MRAGKDRLDLKTRMELARLAYGEQIIRCTDREPEEMEGFLMLDGEVEKSRWWRAFATAKREGHRDYIRGLLVYLVSHHVGECDPLKQNDLTERITRGKIALSDLTIEMLAGTRLKWVHVFQLVGKEFNPTREKEFVRQIYRRLAREEECLSNS